VTRARRNGHLEQVVRDPAGAPRRVRRGGLFVFIGVARHERSRAREMDAKGFILTGPDLRARSGGRSRAIR
jgi:hypothetical protein